VVGQGLQLYISQLARGGTAAAAAGGSSASSCLPAAESEACRKHLPGYAPGRTLPSHIGALPT